MYEIKVLRSDEFDKVAKSDPRYSHVDDSNLGFADIEQKKVFVRDTGIHELNRYLINHEIDHLVEEHATDEDGNGIRHKKFKDILRRFYNPLNFGDLISKGFGLTDENKGFAGAPKEGQVATTGMEGMANPFESFTVFGGGGQPNTAPGSAAVSQTVTGGQNSSIGPGIQGMSNDPMAGLPPDILQRLRGNVSGRMVF